MLFTLAGFAQNSTTNQAFQSKYHMISKDELGMVNQKNLLFTETNPPTGSIRAIAEFEKNEGVIVTYYSFGGGNWGFGIPINLIAEMSEVATVTTILASSSQESTVLNLYNQNGVNTSNCNFLVAPSDSYWSRDYSPWFVAVDNVVSVIDFPYDRPSRPDDDNIPVEFASAFGMNLYAMNLTQTGGNYMCDGMGVAASTLLVEEENSGLSTAQIQAKMNTYMGIENYHITPDPLGDYIKHIDCWGKFLDVDKILIAQVSVSDPRYADYEAMANYWASQTSSYGNNYQVFRTYSPNGQPYTNSLILNNKVLVPTVDGTGSEWNDEALAVYADAMPGYQIVPILESGYNATWYETDALHCRTHEIPDRGMLYINHFPLLGEVAWQTEYLLQAEIIPYSGEIINGASVFYSIDGGVYQEISMAFAGGNSWQCSIPQQLAGSIVDYYIQASDASPRTATHPFIGSGDPHEFIVGNTTNRSLIANPENDIRVYPNPAKEFIMIDVFSEITETANLFIVDMSGRKVYESEIQLKAGNILERTDISFLNKGMYFAGIRTSNNKILRKSFIVE